MPFLSEIEEHDKMPKINLNPQEALKNPKGKN